MLARCVEHSIAGGARLLTGARARWVGCGPACENPRIYFANHTSHIDFLLLWTALPPALRRRTRPVAAADYWQRGPVRRYLIHEVFTGVTIDRAVRDRHTDPLSPLVQALDAGNSLILFPEGTRGDGEDLLPFKPGLFHLARLRPRVELVPVYMDNSYRVMPKGSLLPVPLLCSVTFGVPVHLGPSEDKHSFLTRMRDSLLDLRTE